MTKPDTDIEIIVSTTASILEYLEGYAEGSGTPWPLTASEARANIGMLVESAIKRARNIPPPYDREWEPVADGESFESVQRRRLLRGLHDLWFYVSHDVGAMVSRQLGAVITAAAGTYGDDVWRQLGRPITRAERVRLGYCPFCTGSPRRIDREGPGGAVGACAECYAEHMADEAAAEASEREERQ